MMKKSEREIKETLPFTIATKRIKYLGINLTKKVKISILKTNTMMKETKEYTNKWKDNLLFGLKGLLKFPYCSKPSTDSLQFLSRFPMEFFTN